jgi:hypothetical protein
MEFVSPLPFEEAIQKVGERSRIGSTLRSWYWSNVVPVGLRDRAFFSATIEDVRFLDRAEQFFENFLTGARAADDAGGTYLKAGGRAQFIDELQKFALREGMGPLDPEDAGTMRDITSAPRLALIFDTNIKAAHDFGYWKQGQDPDVLNSFPAQRFIRVVQVTKPRPVHETNRDAVRRKDDINFWLAMNDPKIGGFGVPWGPWGFNSGMDVEDVSRRDAEALGLVERGERMQPVQGELNDRLQASTQNLDPRLVNFLKAAFGDQVTFEGDLVKWQGGKQ